MSEQTREEHFESKLRRELLAQGADKRTIERHVSTYNILLEPSLGGNTPETAFRVTLDDYRGCQEMRQRRQKPRTQPSRN